MKLIDKDALVAKIDRRIKVLRNNPHENHKTICHLDSLKQSLDTLEVKEVDLEKEIEVWEDSFKHCPASMGYKETAKHFFELGMQASNPLTWGDIARINDIISEIITECGDKILYDTQENFCKEVLKRFKAQKGEEV